MVKLHHSRTSLPCFLGSMVACFSLILPCHSAQIEFYEISSIQEVQSFLKHASSQSSLVVFDWDNTVTLKDGNDEDFREPYTKATIQHIRGQKYDFLVLTSRLSGRPLKDISHTCDIKHNISALNLYLKEMDEHFKILSELKTLKPLSPEDGAVLIDMPICDPIHEGEDTHQKGDFAPDHMILTNNIVFAGSWEKEKSNKGPALAKLLDLNLQGSQSTEPEDGPIFTSNHVHTHVIFVDNDMDHIESMRSSFKERQEKLTLLYYPIDNEG